MIKINNIPQFGKPSSPSGEVGVVVEVMENTVRVRPQSSTVCETCGSASLCFPGEGHDTVIEALNLAGATAGDIVSLVQGEGHRIGASLIVFGLPVALTLGGTFLGMQSAIDSSGGAAAGAIAGLALGMLLVRGINKLIGASNTYKPVAREIIGHHDEALED